MFKGILKVDLFAFLKIGNEVYPVTTGSIQGYQKFFAQCIYTTLCDLLISYLIKYCNVTMKHAYCPYGQALIYIHQ